MYSVENGATPRCDFYKSEISGSRLCRRTAYVTSATQQVADASAPIGSRTARARPARRAWTFAKRKTYDFPCGAGRKAPPAGREPASGKLLSRRNIQEKPVEVRQLRVTIHVAAAGSLN
jgi:hypothetical protein